MKIKTNFNYLIIGFFFTFLLIGHLIFKDYLVTPDEPLHRINGFISLKYILEILSINFSSITQFENVPNGNPTRVTHPYHVHKYDHDQDHG